MTDFTANKNIISVSQLNRRARDLLEHGLPLLWVEGEISNLARPASGHLYFTLKDAHAQIRCALFKNRRQRSNATMENGSQILVKAKISLYESRGDYQLIVEAVEDAGDGALRRAFDELKLKLDKEGLFDQAHKQALPTLPRKIGVITSPSGAAIRDIISVLKRRFPLIPLLIYPVAVQGDNAAAEIAKTIAYADQQQDCDVLIIGRGGGSLEDLWAFNEEIVARAIHQCSIPTVSAVGHEVDFSISDLVADYRAPTPSAAAEILSPDQRDYLNHLELLKEKLQRGTQQKINQSSQQLDWLEKRLRQQHPGQRLKIQQQLLNDQQHRLRNSMHRQLTLQRNRLELLDTQLQHHNPVSFIQQQRPQLKHQQQRLQKAMTLYMERHNTRLQQCATTLDTVSPLATLARGYAIVKNEASGAILRQAEDSRVDDRIDIQLKQGSLICKVEVIHKK